MDAFFYIFIYLFCSQVCFNHLIDGCHFSYITKLKGKKSDTERNFEMEISIYVFICIITMSRDCNLGVGNENNLKGGKRISRILGQN